MFPISHQIKVINGKGKILVYEVNDITYSGMTKDITSTFAFEHNMKVEWENGSYYSKVFQNSVATDKLLIKYRINTEDFIKNVRLFDPNSKISSNYFASDNINVNDFWINKYDDSNYGTVSKISMDLNNSDNYLNDKTVQIVIAYPENQDFLNLVITPTNENGKDGLAGNREISKEDINVLEVKTKTKNSNDKQISDKLKNISKNLFITY